MIKEKSAWAPFSIGTSEVPRIEHLFPSSPSDVFLAGPYNCIGRSFALMNLRTTVARFVMNFDIRFSPEDDDNGRRFEAGTTEHFTLSPAVLNMCFEKRQMPKK